MRNPNSPVINSSEIASYFYSPEAWLKERFEGKTFTGKMKEGINSHENFLSTALAAGYSFTIFKYSLIALVLLGIVYLVRGLIWN